MIDKSVFNSLHRNDIREYHFFNNNTSFYQHRNENNSSRDVNNIFLSIKLIYKKLFICKNELISKPGSIL